MTQRPLGGVLYLKFYGASFGASQNLPTFDLDPKNVTFRIKKAIFFKIQKEIKNKKDDKKFSKAFQTKISEWDC